jgi:hypothetical protein
MRIGLIGAGFAPRYHFTRAEVGLATLRLVEHRCRPAGMEARS